jgi:hypothetical protein
MCATKTCSIPLSSMLLRPERPAFLRALTILVDAFREARSMQRVARRRQLLNDE